MENKAVHNVFCERPYEQSQGKIPEEWENSDMRIKE
jgi:hypothetical protein